MEIQSTRFGSINVDHGDMLLMPQGLIGFETCRHWVMLSNPDFQEVAWLQSVGLSHVAIPVISPKRFAPEFKVSVSRRQLSMLHLRNEDQIFVLSVVSKSGLTLTTNLKSPIVLNATRQLAVQVICNSEAPMSLPIGLSDKANKMTDTVSTGVRPNSVVAKAA